MIITSADAPYGFSQKKNVNLELTHQGRCFHTNCFTLHFVSIARQMRSKENPPTVSIHIFIAGVKLLSSKKQHCQQIPRSSEHKS